MPTIQIVNGSDRSWTSSRFILWFGAYGTTRLMVWANHLQDALDEAIDWIVDNEPGLLCDEECAIAYQEELAKGKSEEEAYEAAESDVTTGGNCGNHILSYEWGILAENPTRAEVLEMMNR